LAEPEIRPYRPEDADLTGALFRELIPGQVYSARAVQHFVDGQPARARMRAWTAVSGGEVIGWANARLRWSIAADDVASGWVGVLPEYRRAGVGSDLYQLVDEHAQSLGARRFTSFVREASDDGRAFARRRGFVEGRREQYWELDLATGETLQSPLLDLDVSAVVLVDDRPAAFAWLNGDREGGYGENEMTGTHPDFRRRGLARLAKEQSIRWAAEAGLHTLYTSNETTNADMLRLNEHLGYRPTHVQIGLAKDL
jgi:GNAT superfamily N-acetyltransferase